MSSPADVRKRLVLGALAAVVILLVAALLWTRSRPAAPGPAAVKAADAGPAARAPTGPLRTRFEIPPAEALRLVGRVVDARGAPVADAGVLLTGDGARQTRSDRAGGFAFEGLWAGPYLVEAWAGDAAGGPVRVHLNRETPAVVVRLYEAGRLTVKVVSARDGAPLADAAVEVRAQGMMRNHVTVRKGTTDAAGRLEMRGLPPGGYQVAASAKGHRLAAVPLLPVAGLRWEITVTLKPGSEVRARVVDERGAPVAGAVLWGTPWHGRDYVQLTRAVPFEFTARSDAKGDATVVVPAGKHRLMVDHERYLLGWSEPFDADGASPVVGVTVKLASGGVIAGTVVTADRRPVPRAIVRLSPSNATEAAAHGAARQVVCDGDGRFEMAGVPLTAMELAAFADGAASETYALDLAQNKEQRKLVVPLTLEGIISGVVVRTEGTPVADAEVMCVSYQRDAVALRPVAVETTDAAGRFTCGGLTPGKYLVRATLPGSNNVVQPGMRGANTDAQTGDREVKLVVRADGSLSGKVLLPDGRPATEFRLELVGGMEGRTFASPEGAFSVDGLPPFDYVMKVIVAGVTPNKVRAQVVEGQNTDLGVIKLDPNAEEDAKRLKFPSASNYVPDPVPPKPPEPPPHKPEPLPGKK